MATVTQLHINGAPCRVQADAERSLLQVLRHDLDLTGSKYGCGEGKCGACTVILDGQRVRSCVTPVGTVGTKPVRTIEGLATAEKLHPVQEAFLETCAMQCGYCTAGMIMAGLALLKSNSNPANQDVVQALRGNICRCGTYARIVTAIKLAARMLKEAHHG